MGVSVRTTEAAGSVGWRPVAAAIAVITAGLWAFWPALGVLAHHWSTNPQYSHGFLVPAFSAFLLWRRRAMARPAAGAWWGWLVVLAGCALYVVGGRYLLGWPQNVAVVVVAAGLTAALGGWPAVRWAWPAVAFLLFMVPPPTRFETLLSAPMQRVATVVSTNILQTLGFFAQADGTVIILSEVELGIVEACSGLRMLIAFAAMSAGIALVIDRPAWQRVALLAGAVPVALVCNIARIVVTAVIHETAGREIADLVFHDLAGWLMMPAGLALLWLELAFMNRLFLPAESPAPPPAAIAPALTPTGGAHVPA